MEGLFRAGVRLLQYRRKHLSAALSRDEAITLRRLADTFDATLIINDHLELALEVGADGVHWGRDDLPLSDASLLDATSRAKSRANRPFLVGISCYDNFERAQRAVAAGADYVAFGSMFASTTKPAAKTAPVALIARAKRAFTTPVVAIGGITGDNASTVIAAGADAVAVISDLFRADSDSQTHARVQVYLSLFAHQRRHTPS